jgi:hypothetical protein
MMPAQQNANAASSGSGVPGKPGAAAAVDVAKVDMTRSAASANM